MMGDFSEVLRLRPIIPQTQLVHLLLVDSSPCFIAHRLGKHGINQQRLVCSLMEGLSLFYFIFYNSVYSFALWY